jgi:cellobiose-specific phosphotransferase system component IIB
MAGTEDLKSAYRDWMLSQRVEYFTLLENEEGNIEVMSSFLRGAVNFYDIDDVCVVEMRLERSIDGESAFFLHFELEDFAHAQRFFGEMAAVIKESRQPETRQVLLCCSCGLTTGFFAMKLDEAANDLGIGYEFSAKSVDEAMRVGSDYAAVLLAPQVGYQRKEVVAALPGTPVIELPGKIFGSYDALAALRLVIDALSGGHGADVGTSVQLVRDFDKTKRVLALSFIHRVDEPTISYRVLDGGEITVRGQLLQRSFSMREIEDLAATMLVEGYRMSDFDAVGIAIEDLENGAVAAPVSDDEAARQEMRESLERLWGVPVFFNYNATAAAVGCYMTQDEYENVAFHAQAVGVASGAEGYVVEGHPIIGRGGRSGHLGRIAEGFELSMDLAEAAWRVAGVRELVSRFLANLACTIAPEVIYVWCDLLPDMDDLREELATMIPATAIPKLVDVSDYDECVLVGELALCLTQLSSSKAVPGGKG